MTGECCAWRLAGLAGSFPRPCRLESTSPLYLLLACLLDAAVSLRSRRSLGDRPDFRVVRCSWWACIFSFFTKRRPPASGREKKRRREKTCAESFSSSLFLLSLSFFFVRSSFPFSTSPLPPPVRPLRVFLRFYFCSPFASWQISGGISPCLPSFLDSCRPKK